MGNNNFKSKIKSFWSRYENKIVLIIGFILVAAISFEAGILKGQDWQQKPIIIEKPVAGQEICQIAQNSPSQTQNLAPEAQKQVQTTSITSQNCAFVGSKNSDKYHLPTCRWAKQIKPENLICFSSAEDAAAKGYQPDKNCVK